MIWPPPYTLRRKAYLRSVRLRICAERGLLLTVPQRFDLKETSVVLEQHRQWIEKTWKKIQPRVHTTSEELLPTQLTLTALETSYSIDYLATTDEKLHLKVISPQHLVLSGNLNPVLVKLALQRWLQQQAKQSLIPWLESLSRKTGLHYSGASIRNATSRWGSCNVKKRISLNQKLLFLPAHLVESVLLHELCHTVQMNHSKKFWDLLQQWDPNCFEHRKALRKAHQYIPVIFCQELIQ